MRIGEIGVGKGRRSLGKLGGKKHEIGKGEEEKHLLKVIT